MAALILVLGFLGGCRDPDPSVQNQTLDQIVATMERLPRPPHQLIDRIEARLEGRPCIGRLDGWVRTYSFDTHRTVDRSAPARNLIDERHIRLDFREAPAGSGRRELGVPGAFVDDRPGRIVLGSYDRSTDKLWIDVCGENLGGDAPPMENVAF